MLAAIAMSSLLSTVALPEIRRAPQITYLDRSGAVLGVRGGQTPAPVELERLPAYVPAAFVSIEDRRFYEHNGFDAMGMARALVTDLAAGHAAQGASTITQQLARNLFLTPDQTMERKAQELMLAVQLEQKYTKKQILALYLSRVYFGSGAYGLEAASRRFFGKPAHELTVHQAAILAAVLKSPSGYSPVDEPERSAERTRLVLDAMVQTNAITDAERNRALAQPAHVLKVDPVQSSQYFVDWVDGQTRKMVGQPKQDLIVETTLDLPMEESAAASARVVFVHDKKAAEQTALVALDGAGRVRAMVGGVDYGQSQFNRATLGHRQAGSSWKPFVYLTAMEQGRTPDVVVVDEPVTIDGWSPRNHDNGYLGPVTLEQALAKSVNTVAARLADEVGRPKVADTAHRLGITTQISTDPAMALGASEVVPLDMATAYDAFSNGGVRAQAYGVERIRTASGTVVFRHQSDPQVQVVGNPALSEMNRMLRTVITAGTGAGAAIPGYDLAGKTGTTSDGKDAWFCGYTGGMVSCAWVGADDGRPMPHLTGGGSAARLWRGFMVAALPRAGAGAIPAGPAGAPMPPPPTPSLPGDDPVKALLRDAAASPAVPAR